MKNLLAVAAIAGCLMFGADVNAQGFYRNDGRVKHRSVQGRFTPREKQQINFMKADLQRSKRLAMRDGYVSVHERRMIERQERDLARMIYIQRRDS